MKVSYCISKVRVLLVLSIICVMLVAALFPVQAFAKTKTYKASTIPSDMKAGTVIKFINKGEYIIIQGASKKVSKDILARRSKALSEKGILSNESYPNPEKNMTIYYGEDGEVNDIKFASEASEKKFNSLSLTDKNKIEKAFSSANKKSASTLTAKEVIGMTSDKLESDVPKTLIAKWGSKPNKLYKLDSSPVLIYGKGRATVYADKIGQADHKLKKGDVATKLKYDNCKNGITIHTTMKKKGSSKKVTKKMKKWDVGGMPNAIVDIWKTGINYWGYTYSKKSLSNWAKTAEIKHEKK